MQGLSSRQREKVGKNVLFLEKEWVVEGLEWKAEEKSK